VDGKAFFGKQLRELRFHYWALTQEQLAEQLHYSTEYIRSVELCRRSPSVDLGERADKFFGTPGIFTALAREALTDTSPFGELTEHEQVATHISIWENRVIPGLMQTEPYMRALLSDAERIQDRLDRQRILVCDRPPGLHVVLDEAVLYRTLGGTAVFRRQLETLVADDVSWRVQVLPFDSGRHAGLDGPFSLLELPGGSCVVWRGAQEGTLADTVDDVRSATREWEEVLSCALPAAISTEMIIAVADDLPEE